MLNGAVTFQRIKVTDAERTEENAKKCLSGDGSRRGSCKERIRTEQVTDKDWCITDNTNMQRIRNGQNVR